MTEEDLGKPMIEEGDSKVSFFSEIDPSEVKRQLEAERQNEDEEPVEKASRKAVDERSETESGKYITLKELKENMHIREKRANTGAMAIGGLESPAPKPEIQNIMIIPKSRIVAKGKRCPKCNAKLKIKHWLKSTAEGVFIDQLIKCKRNGFIKRCDHMERIRERID